MSHDVKSDHQGGEVAAASLGPGSFAVAYTVKDEWEMLRYVIPYYLARGAERVFLYWDGTTDGAREGVAAFERVHARENVAIDELAQVPAWVEELDPAIKMTHRKRINVLHAAEQARHMGIEWILAIDPDEIVLHEPGYDGLSAMLSAVVPGVEQVLSPNLELLPSGSTSDNPFASERVFLLRQERVYNLWRSIHVGLRRVMSPRQCARVQNWIYRTANGGLFPPVIHNPIDGRPIYRSLFLGYTNFKPFMRTTVAHHYNYNIHKWEKVKRPLKSVKAGRLLHYDLPNFDYYRKKFRQRPANHMAPAFDTRFQLGEIAREAPREVAHRFYSESLSCSDPSVVERLISAGIATRVDDVANFFMPLQNPVQER